MGGSGVSIGANWFAYLMLILWPLVSIKLYMVKTIQQATLWTIILGIMILPSRLEIDFPGIPAIDKDFIIVFSVIVGCWVIKGEKIIIFFGGKAVQLCVLLMFLVPFITVELNQDLIMLNNRVIPGLSHYDALTYVVDQVMFVFPIFIGRKIFRTYENQVQLFKFLVVAGLVYSFPILLEVRLSPKFNSLVYGYFPHSFIQQKRQGGFRPIVFMGHGLWVAFFMVVVAISASALRASAKNISKLSSGYIGIYFLIILILCKSIASLVYGVFSVFIIKFLSPKIQVKISVLLVLLALTYPTMSIMKIFPHQMISEFSESIDQDRAQSLMFRFDNEKILLEHGLMRPYFGWGGWGRNRVYDNLTDEDITVTDGRWIITFGKFGWFGFISEFGLIAISVFGVNSVINKIESEKEVRLLAAHSLLIGVILIDQLPNATLAPWLWLLVGGLFGRVDDVFIKNKK